MKESACRKFVYTAFALVVKFVDIAESSSSPDFPFIFYFPSFCHSLISLYFVQRKEHARENVYTVFASAVK